MSRKFNSIDKHVASKLLAARKEAGLSQTEAGEFLGVSFQQIQKIDRGANRISAGNLHKLAAAYGKPISWFFEGLDTTAKQTTFDDLSTKFIGADHGVALARDYLAIKCPEQRKAVVNVAAAFARVG